MTSDEPDRRTALPGAEWERWLEAAKILSADASARVLCPHAGDDYLEVMDLTSEADPRRSERVMRCPTCGHYNAILRVES